MKKIIALFISVSFITTGFTQTFQASIKPLPASGAGITVFVKTPNAVTGKVSSLTITIAIPVTAGPRPSLSLDNSGDPFITYDIYNAINQNIGPDTYYIYNLLGTGDVVSPGASKTFAAGNDEPMVIVHFNGAVGTTALVKMANLPDGGTDMNANSYFGFSIDGVDVVNTGAMFYGIPTISSATNDGLGYAGTSFATTIALVPLPIKFLGFNAIKKDDDALLDWNVQNESGITSYYEIERSLTGADFTKIETVSAFNNGYSSNTYTSTDHHLSSLRTSGAIYYRIKQVDRDGRVVYSETRSVRMDGKTFDVRVYPNPVVSEGNVYIDLADAARINIKLVDATGKTLETAVVKGVKGLNTYPLNMNKLAAGTYIVQVEAGAQNKSIPVIKK